MARRPTLMRQRALAIALTSALALLNGCSRVKQTLENSVNNNAQIRQGAMDSARNSCIQQATAKAPKLPGLQTRINSYCDCFATKGLGQFSNSELASIGFHGGKLTQDQQTRVLQGAMLCRAALIAPADHGKGVPR